MEIAELRAQLEKERLKHEQFEDQSREIAEFRRLLETDRQKREQTGDQSKEIAELQTLLENERQKLEQLEQELRVTKTQMSKRNVNGSLTRQQGDELLTVRHRLDEELRERERLVEEIRHLKEQVAVLTEEHDEVVAKNIFTSLIPYTYLGSEWTSGMFASLRIEEIGVVLTCF
jgi:kinesin family protein 5